MEDSETKNQAAESRTPEPRGTAPRVTSHCVQLGHEIMPTNVHQEYLNDPGHERTGTYRARRLSRSEPESESECGTQDSTCF